MSSLAWRSAALAAPLLAIALACGGVIDGPDASLSAGGGRCGPMAPIEFWSGEYPSPVIQVDKELSLPARADPCSETPSVACAIPSGLYHPWAGQGRYLTLREPTRFRVTSDFTFEEGPAVREGDIVTVAIYLAEGYCSMVHGETEFAATCPGMGEMPLELVAEPTTEPIQLFDPGCGAWIDVDDALFVRPEIQHGQITGYGEIGPAE